MAGKPFPSPFPLFSGELPAGNPIYLSSPNIIFLDSDSDSDDSHHFLDSCFLCKKHLTGNRDIYMYRGDMPFCSNECRQEQIEIDEDRERKLKIAMRKEQRNNNNNNNSSNPNKSEKIGIRVGAVVPA